MLTFLRLKNDTENNYEIRLVFVERDSSIYFTCERKFFKRQYNIHMLKSSLYPLLLTPTIKNYIWGGQKFKQFSDPNDHAETPDSNPLPIAEVWAIYDQNLIRNGVFAGKQLSEIVRQMPDDFLGEVSYNCDDKRFPLLIKLLDCKEWLSVQVHPGDQEAKLLEGPGFHGKTESWFFLDTDTGAEIIAGTLPGIEQKEIQEAIANHHVMEIVKSHKMYKNDYIFIEAGTIHALGPGLTVYELQQSSDLTYRVYDWDRPATAGRPLHLEKSAEASKPIMIDPIHLKGNEYGFGRQKIITCPYFELEHINNKKGTLHLDTENHNFHALTIIEGNAELDYKGQLYKLKKYESILLPACLGDYQMRGQFTILKAVNA